MREGRLFWKDMGHLVISGIFNAFLHLAAGLQRCTKTLWSAQTLSVMLNGTQQSIKCLSRPSGEFCSSAFFSSCVCMALTCLSAPELFFPELGCECLHALCSVSFLMDLHLSHYHPNYCNWRREPMFQLCHTSLVNVKSHLHQSVSSVLKNYL